MTKDEKRWQKAIRRMEKTGLIYSDEKWRSEPVERRTHSPVVDIAQGKDEGKRRHAGAIPTYLIPASTITRRMVA